MLLHWRPAWWPARRVGGQRALGGSCVWVGVSVLCCQARRTTCIQGTRIKLMRIEQQRDQVITGHPSTTVMAAASSSGGWWWGGVCPGVVKGCSVMGNNFAWPVITNGQCCVLPDTLRQVDEHLLWDYSQVNSAQNTIDDKSTLVQVTAWCHETTSHLSQCWPKFANCPWD